LIGLRLGQAVDAPRRAAEQLRLFVGREAGGEALEANSRRPRDRA
jgi:hypothetical protein